MRKNKDQYNSRIIIACDMDSREELYHFLLQFNEKKLFLKLGMQILYKEGFGFINELQKKGHNIFIDLKIHDIPNTAKHAVRSLMTYEPNFLTIHTLGGLAMMKDVVKIVSGTKTKILGVTILTSLDKQDLESINISKKVDNQVEDLIILAKKAGVTHIVCSSHEAFLVKKHGLVSVTPGIRMLDDDNHDQSRVVTPRQAIANGSDFIVVGRSITQSTNPLHSYEQIEKEIENEINC